ncbi:MAG: O-antigen ligase family protein, partial [Coprothermobacterota bacterium]|nr:O-antigen ligase family protein [Coprothermobacterota bacterium]
IYFALEFLFGSLSGSIWIFIAIAITLLGLLGIALPSTLFQGSFLGRRIPHRDTKHLPALILMGVFIAICGFFWNPLYVALLLLSVVFSVWVLSRPEVGLYAIAAYALLDFLIRSSFPSTIAKYWSFGLLTFILVGILFQLAKYPNRKFYFTWVGFPLLVLLLWCILSMAFTKVSFDVGFEGIRAILQTSLFFFATVNAIRTRRQLQRFFFILALMLAVVSLYAIYQYIIQVPVKPGWVDVDFEQDIISRSYSIFSSPNALSGYLVLFIPLLLVLLLEERAPAAKMLYLAVTGLAALALIFTLTRAAWLACGLSLIFLGILHDRRILLLVGLVGVLLPAFPEFSQRFTTLISGEYWVKSATAGRLYRWQLGQQIAEGNPLFGSGPGTFGGAVAFRAGYWPGIYADNYYIKTMAEIGFPGLIFFLLTLLSLLVAGFQRIRSLTDRKLRNIGWGIEAGLIAFLIHMFTENLWEEPSLAVAFWMLGGIMLALPWLEKPIETS